MGEFGSFLGGGAGEDPYTSNKAAFDQYGQEMDKAAKRYDPYFDRGNKAGEAAYNAYSRDVEDPNYMQNKISAGFEASPYQKMLLDQVTKRMNYNSANTGMMGSGAAQRALMEELTKNTGQFQNEYVQRGLGVYGQGLNGLNTQQDLGLKAGSQQDDLLQEAAGGRLKGSMSENETNDRNRASNTQRGSDMWGSILGMAGTAAGAYFGGPMGAQIGGQIGQKLGGGGGAQGGGGGGGGFSASNYMGGGQYSNNQYNTGNRSF